MTFARIRLAPAVVVSLAAHLALGAVFLPQIDDMQIAGGAEVNVTIIGTDAQDALKAGEAVEAPDAADTPEAVETVEAVEAEPVEAVQPAPVEVAVVEPQPVTEAPEAPAETAEIVPAEPVVASPIQELAALSEEPAAIAPVPEPVETVAPVELPQDMVIPVPEPRPDPKKIETVKAVEPEPVRPKVTAKPERAKPEQTVEKPARTDANPKAAAKPKKPAGGDGGAQASTATKGASGGKTAGKSTQAGNAAVSNYPGKVASKLRRSLRYPREARGGKLRGEVLVSFVVGSNGSVSSVRVARSSGSPVLDQAAGDAVRRAAPFPPIPDGAGRSNWTFSVPLAFTR